LKIAALFVLSLAARVAVAADPPAVSGPVDVQVAPDRVYIERTAAAQFVTCDFFLTNRGTEALEITDIRAKAFDSGGTLFAWRKIDSNGSRPSVEVLGTRRIEPGATLTVFNPFDEFHVASPIDRLAFEFRFAGEKGETRETVEVRPSVFAQKTRLILPVPGATLFAYDGPGLYSHHRRLDVHEPFNRDIMKIRENSQRYAVDLVVLDPAGSPFHGDPRDQKNWFGLGHPVVAPGDGVVVEAVGNLPDDIPYNLEKLKSAPDLMAGNHVLIDHRNGEFSLLCHFRSGSVSVKPGQLVKRGDPLGEMGHSGMGSGLVHVHYELRDGGDLRNAEGLPARFEGFRLAGAKAPDTGRVEAGAIVVTEPAAR
jgi:peptidase M23-like protein